jgi:uncharacterized protein (DUF4415 family)
MRCIEPGISRFSDVQLHIGVGAAVRPAGMTVEACRFTHPTSIRRGRPKSDDPNRQITLRLDAAVLRWFQQSGPGYQSRIGAALKSHMTRKKAAAKAAPRGKTLGKKRTG